jgi:DNA sulfur modification protein DndE
MSGGIRNVYIKNCSFLGTNVGIRFKTIRGRGGIVENIYIQDIRMKDIPSDAVRFTMYYEHGEPVGKDDKKDIPAINEGTPRFQNIYMKNILCEGAKRAVYMEGLPEMAVRNINLENVSMTAQTGVTCIEADGVKFKNVKIISAISPVFKLYNSRNFSMEQVSIPDSEEIFAELKGDKTENIFWKGLDASVIKRIHIDKNVKSNALITD